MQSDEEINSESYWNRRFAVDWDDNKGREQTRFFAGLAVSNLPGWLVRDIRRDSLSVCDWGCAEGDGVDVLQSHLGVPVTGIDFSLSAIEKARSYYPGRQFVCADYLSEQSHPEFDVFFSSNTLEHFDLPWQIFEKISKFARKFVILLVPFREYQRHHEHFFTFDYDNVPMVLADFHLVSAIVVDSGSLVPSYWPGEQVLLLFARNEYLEILQLKMGDVRLDSATHIETLGKVASLKMRDSEIREQIRIQSEGSASLAGALEQARQESARMQEELRYKAHIEGVLKEREARLAYADAQYALIKKELSDTEKGRKEIELRCRLAETNLEQLREQYEQLRSSNSWNIMRPFRYLRRMMFGTKD